VLNLHSFNEMGNVLQWQGHDDSTINMAKAMTIIIFIFITYGLNREDAMDHSRWSKQRGMIDDHDECEWVNVSSGASSSRLSLRMFITRFLCF